MCSSFFPFFFYSFNSADEDDIDEDVGADGEAETEPISLASMLNAGDDYYGYDDAY